jgi:hypothetical protein
MSDKQRYELHRLGVKLKFVYSIVGLVLGMACILTGLTLGLFGVIGHTSLTASLLGFSTNLNDAAPGVVVFIVGVLMVLITRFKVREIRHESVSRDGTRYSRSRVAYGLPSDKWTGSGSRAKQEGGTPADLSGRPGPSTMGASRIELRRAPPKSGPTRETRP